MKEPTQLNVEPIEAFSDNYIWLLRREGMQHAVCVDPGDATPVLHALNANALNLSAILITHHHHDHIGGIAELLEHFPQCKVFAPSDKRVPHATYVVGEGETITLDHLNCQFEVLEVPGHTRSHIAYYGEGCLFCGDTVFACGCGRLFEGSAKQMHQSLNKIMQLPDTTQIYCAHEYTLANIRFAKQVEPDNAALLEREASEEQKRAAGIPTVPSSLALEKETNPFLRSHHHTVALAASNFCQHQLDTSLEVFTQIRCWKDQF